MGKVHSDIETREKEANWGPVMVEDAVPHTKKINIYILLMSH